MGRAGTGVPRLPLQHHSALICSAASNLGLRRPNAPSWRFMIYVRSQAWGAIYSPEGLVRLTAKVLSGSLVLPR
jgi:hypothetical protein